MKPINRAKREFLLHCAAMLPKPPPASVRMGVRPRPLTASEHVELHRRSMEEATDFEIRSWARASLVAAVSPLPFWWSVGNAVA